jgi:hypothetical protein
MQLTEEDLTLPPDLDDVLARIERVHEDDTDVTSYADIERDIVERGAQDDVEGLGAGGDINTPKEAVSLGRAWIAAFVFFGVGYCLRTMRNLFKVDALWLDAETAWEEAKFKHPVTDLAKIPWGVLIWWTNGRHGHVALYIGNGWCITTDYKRAGYLCIARVDALASWCGGTFRGWTEDVNNVRIWKPKTKTNPYGIDDRIADLQALLKRAEAHNARKARIDGIKKWLGRMEERRDRINEKKGSTR